MLCSVGMLCLKTEYLLPSNDTSPFSPPNHMVPRLSWQTVSMLIPVVSDGRLWKNSDPVSKDINMCDKNDICTKLTTILTNAILIEK